jgi:probable HAF family extracellular repeat protein
MLSLAAAGNAATHRYDVVTIGVLPGLVASHAQAINDSGVVIGHSFNPANTPTPMLHAHRQLVPLPGLLPGTRLAGINDAGTIAGTDVSWRAFRYVNGVTSYIAPETADPSSAAIVFGINDAGTVVGASTGDGRPWRTFVAQGDTMHELDIPGESLGHAINNRGEVAGALRSSDSHRGFLYSNGTVVDIGDLGTNYTAVADINDAGAIVGQTGDEAYIYEHGAMRSLGTFIPGAESFATAINNRGQVIGRVVTGPQQIAPFLWQNDVMVDLRELVDPSFVWGSWVDVRDINDAGQIVGVNCTDSCVGFVLTPVPEPSGAASLAVGLALLAPLAWRRMGTTRRT